MSKAAAQNDTDWSEDAAEKLRVIAWMLDNGKCTLHEVPPIHAHNLYLLTNFLYNHTAKHILSDASYDKLCLWLLEHYDEYYTYFWWPGDTLDKELLSSGTVVPDIPWQIRQISEVIPS